MVLVEGISIILHDGNSKMLYLMLMLMFDQDTMVDLCILSSIYQPDTSAQAVSPAVQLTDDKQNIGNDYQTINGKYPILKYNFLLGVSEI